MAKKRKNKKRINMNVPVSPVKTAQDREALMKLFSQNPRNLALFTLGITSALRISDLLALKVSDVVFGGIDSIRIADRITIREQKTDKVKSFPIHHKARAALRSYLRVRRPTNANEALFISRQRTHEGTLCQITREQAWRIISSAGELAGLTYTIGTHSMRKTFGYLLYQQTKDIALVQKTLNHTDQGHTLRYIGIEQEDIDLAHLSIDI